MPWMKPAEETAYLGRLLDEGGVSDAALTYLAATLFSARAIERAVKDSPLHISAMLDEEMGVYRSLTAKPRGDIIEGLRASFGLDRCLMQLTYLGSRLPGVEWPERIAKLGAQPSIRWKGREVYRGNPHVTRDLYDVLIGAKKTDPATQQSVWLLLGAEGTGELTLTRDDGTRVESEIVTAKRHLETEPDSSPVHGP